ncbi:hypothetical protein RND81_01G012200 [Saponaria officinalis]|uniref:Exostosin GT47 domain-containing protein n=1 Tax=Saponaria officinalis TaxID=3572 RepID=A0AAW1NAS9_SAPOF
MSTKMTFTEKSTVGNSTYFSILWFVILTFLLSFSIIYFDYLIYNLPKIANISILNINNNNNNNNIPNINFPSNVINKTAENKASVNSDDNECAGKYIYIQDLPRQFNDDIVHNCTALNQWVNVCKTVTNFGLGPRLNGSGWYATDQFTLEIIFYNRMKKYRCLTDDSSKANAVFVPFYAGLDVGRYLWNGNVKIRDAKSNELVKFLREKPEWKRLYGRDHFMVAGRISWDFMRVSDRKNPGWGNRLFLLPEVQNMTSLSIESSPWSKTDFAIPYPTYFHPSTDKQIDDWQKQMRKQIRPFFYSFAGAPRPNQKDSIRNEIINQCIESRCNCCKLMNCDAPSENCREATNVINLFRKSVFCLQPPGDSYTRRSAFDSILAGCIPVFFHPGSAYVQYLWHLPKNYTKYSVFIPIEEVKKGNFSIEKKLLSIPKEEIRVIREEVIKLIPRVVYAHPNSRLVKFEDAFDLSLKGVLNRVSRIKRVIKEVISNSSTYESFDEVDHQWDAYFGRT